MSENLQPTKNHEDGVIFVSSETNTKGLAVCIFACATKENRNSVKLRGIGAGAIGQMTKAYIIAKGRLMEKGIACSVDMSFKDINSGDKNITAIEYTISFVK